MMKQMYDNPELFFSNLRGESAARLNNARAGTPRDRVLPIATAQIAQVGMMAARLESLVAQEVLARSMARFEALMAVCEDLLISA
jgi:Ser/Thr protein kinase RdoA (MazF antagonist)